MEEKKKGKMGQCCAKERGNILEGVKLESIRHTAIWSCCFQVIIVKTDLKSLWYLGERAATHGQTYNEGVKGG